MVGQYMWLCGLFFLVGAYSKNSCLILGLRQEIGIIVQLLMVDLDLCGTHLLRPAITLSWMEYRIMNQSLPWFDLEGTSLLLEPVSGLALLECRPLEVNLPLFCWACSCRLQTDLSEWSVDCLKHIIDPGLHARGSLFILVLFKRQYPVGGLCGN